MYAGPRAPDQMLVHHSSEDAYTSLRGAESEQAPSQAVQWDSEAAHQDSEAPGTLSEPSSGLVDAKVTWWPLAVLVFAGLTTVAWITAIGWTVAWTIYQLLA